MEKYLIKGGKKLEGTVELSGAKNSALKLMAASLLASGKTTLKNIPRIADVFTMAEVLKELGARINFLNDRCLKEKSRVCRQAGNVLEINASKLTRYEASYELVSRMRASIIVLGPLLARFGRAKVALPGGCNIGSRKIDLHLFGLELLGAEIEVEHGFIEAKTKGLCGTLIPLSFPSVGATENILMAAVLAKGTTVIENAAREPEVVDLANFLNKMGAKIFGIGTTTIEIEGVSELKGTDYSVIPDRIEAGTFIMAGILTGGNVTVENVLPEHMGIVLEKLKETGAWIKEFPSKICASSSKGFKAIYIATLPYPGFPTDLQAPMAV
ncbi:MAG: UDP-N-acetylglucosamine 1-carboxyvinyltransferase, partial [Candidatus Subteraquimicrobiales bacterium]|nr:UDP-N-acetylglucosamine 1-carboxyvinyltransferase [Candidatus Subteraquimicrobiales bacterium]